MCTTAEQLRMKDQFINLIDFSLWGISFVLGVCGGIVRISARIKCGRPLFMSIGAASIELFSFGACGILGMFLAKMYGYSSSEEIGLSAMVGGWAGISAFKLASSIVCGKVRALASDNTTKTNEQERT